MKDIILASASLRRTQLLNQLAIEHTIIIPNVREDNYNNLLPEQYVREVSIRKAMYVKNIINKCCIIVAADTIVVSDNKIIGKPKTNEDSLKTLTLLSGKDHWVFTGLTVLDIGDNYCNKQTIVEKTLVKMRGYKKDEIIKYINTGEPFGKAGSYAIQGRGAALVKSITGDFYNVVGLPLSILVEILKQLDNINC